MTCGLRTSESPTSDNLNPQETTKQDSPNIELDGADLSCPGSSGPATFENPDTPKTIRRHLLPSDQFEEVRRSCSVYGAGQETLQTGQR